MIDDHNLDPLRGLPPELAELDQELRELRIAERSSFAPELRAELERSWRRRDATTAGPGRLSARALATAATVTVLFGGLMVPPARASLVNLSRSALETIGLLDEESADEEISLDPLTASPPPAVPLIDPDAGSTESAPRVEAPPQPAPEEASGGIAATFPELLHRTAEEDAIRRYYPRDLQRQGIGGTVRVRIWVDSTGRVDNPSIQESSGVGRLDRAGLLAVDDLRFIPATRGGVAVGTWADVDLVFSPSAPEDLPLPAGPALSEPGELEGLDLELGGWIEDVEIRPPGQVGARELLRTALSHLDDGGAELGSLDDLLVGDPPDGAPPAAWRARAMDVLDGVIAAHPENPAPYLAMGRLLRKQGLASEARRLFERGLATTPSEGDVRSTEVQAELHYELGLLQKEAWLQWKDLGRVESSQDLPRCTRGPDDTGEEATDLIALNYLCPASTGIFLNRAFRPLSPGMDHRRAMTAAFEEAVQANPAHPGASVEILLDLAEQERWDEVLDGAVRFARAADGHPHALLMKGLALQRMGHSEEASEALEQALADLPEAVARSLADPGWVMDPGRREELARLPEDRRASVVEAFWSSLDPILLTPVNERRVEHLARSGHAFLRFGTEGGHAQELWVRYGPPQRIRAIGEGTALRTEFWDYGPGPDLTFRRPAVSAVAELTPEGRAYLGDLRRSFPEWYGHRSRRVRPLDGRVARFLAPGSGMELEVSAALPRELLDTGSGGRILGIFTLDESGRVLSRSREPVEGATLNRSIPAGDGVRSVVVEVWDSAGAEAATMRTLVALEDGPVLDRRMSDLALLSPEAGTGTTRIRRGAALPLLPPGDVQGGQVDVFFELYGPVEQGYRVRADAVPEGGGAAVPLRTRPRGESTFQERWLRTADGAAAAAERITVDLSGLTEGAWTLRVSVDLQTEDLVLERTTALRIPALEAAGRP